MQPGNHILLIKGNYLHAHLKLCLCMCVHVCICVCVLVYAHLQLKKRYTDFHQTWHAHFVRPGRYLKKMEKVS
jgi:hypothetical protein